jgi:glucose/arabinose dehydrogenase
MPDVRQTIACPHVAFRDGLLRAAAVVLVALGAAACGGHGDAATTASSGKRSGSTSASGGADATPAAGRPAVVAAGIPFPTDLTFDRRGGLWVTSSSRGAQTSDGVWYVPRGGRPRHVAKGLAGALGLTWAGNRLYVSHVVSARSGRVTMLTGFNGSGFRHRRIAIDHVPIGEHTMGSIVQGRDGRLFVRAGAGSDSGKPTGRILSFAPGGHTAAVEAVGLNGSIGLALAGGRLVMSDPGRNDLGPSRPPEEVDAFDPAGPVADFGFPACYGQGGEACAGARAPVAELPPHATPSGIAVAGDVAYVTENGSAFTQNPTGSDVVRVDLNTGRHTVMWRSPIKHDPLGAAIGPDGDLYLTLYASGKIVRFDL